MKLTVSLDAVAALRESGGGSQPEPAAMAALAEAGGASAIAVRVRSERQPITDRDLEVLRRVAPVPLVIHTSAREETLRLALAVRPDRVVIVPDRREESVLEGGVDIVLNAGLLGRTISGLVQNNQTVGIRIDPEPEQVKAARKLDATHVEIDCRRWLDSRGQLKNGEEWERLAQAVKVARRLGLTVTLSGAIDYQSAAELGKLEDAEALLAGHALAARALLVGWEQATRDFLTLLR